MFVKCFNIQFSPCLGFSLALANKLRNQVSDTGFRVHCAGLCFTVVNKLCDQSRGVRPITTCHVRYPIKGLRHGPVQYQVSWPILEWSPPPALSPPTDLGNDRQ